MPWSDEFISGSVQKAWLLKEYKAHRENMLLDQERARLPESQEDAVRYAEAKKYVEEVRGKIAALQKEMYALPEVIAYDSHIRYSTGISSYQYQMAAEAAKRPYLIRIRSYRELPEYVRSCGIVDNYGAIARAAGTVEAPKSSGWSFVMKCPTDTCDGFVSKSWSCGLCKVKVCKECREQICESQLAISDCSTSLAIAHHPDRLGDQGGVATRKPGREQICGESHTCNEATVLNVKALVQEAKPCPKCASMISKVDGCDQMWCTQCHVAFSWRTGHVETVVHNPHFYEWKRRNGGLAASGPVGACLDPITMLENIGGSKWGYDCRSTERKLCEFARKVIEVHATLRNPYQREVQDAQIDSEERRRVLRVRRLLKELDDTNWKTFLQRDEKARNKTRQLADIYDMFVQTSCDLLRPLHGSIKRTTPTEKDTLLQQLQELTKYANEQLGLVRTRFNSKVVDIDCTV
jgi:hypothetical protein